MAVSEFVENAQANGANLDDAELAFVEKILADLELGISGRSAFVDVATAVDAQMESVRSNGFSREAFENRPQIVVALCPSADLHEEEIEFLSDVKAAIEFGVNNGMTFHSIFRKILRDFRDLRHNGFDFQKTCRSGVFPEVAGAAKLTASPFAWGGDD